MSVPVGESRASATLAAQPSPEPRFRKAVNRVGLPQRARRPLPGPLGYRRAVRKGQGGDDKPRGFLLLIAIGVVKRR
jgi:hypothetical protein